ncbi:hypothetical protein IXB28_09155 [Leptothoe kymatousa TAU-MAC 1615]|uniref:Uncharacterized protein n=1 Tax=Leptothoe kymatousa TAU-MAC 1615 TaxID=2364775 RepID=A0ABS5Y3I7_9CYAN|nr:hypothetical protein [Leptothoe kymatousa TAU-MAC 1615]
MKFANCVSSKKNNGQAHEEGQGNSNTQSSQEQMMSLVYPDGSVTNVKVRRKKS